MKGGGGGDGEKGGKERVGERGCFVFFCLKHMIYNAQKTKTTRFDGFGGPRGLGAGWCM